MGQIEDVRIESFERDSSMQMVVDYFVLRAPKNGAGSWSYVHVGCAPVIGWGMVKWIDHFKQPLSLKWVREERLRILPIVIDEPGLGAVLDAPVGREEMREWNEAESHWWVYDVASRAEWHLRWVTQDEWFAAMKEWTASSYELLYPESHHDGESSKQILRGEI